MTLQNINPDAPEFVKDIKGKSDRMPVPINVDNIVQNPYSVTIPGDFESPQEIHGESNESGFLETAKKEAYQWNYTAQALHAGYNQFQKVDPLQDIPPTDWTPKTDTDKFLNVQPEYQKYLFDATGPKDQQYRLNRILQEQADDEVLANGSWLAKVVGGVAGIATDPISWIPVVGYAKYAKLAPTILKTAARVLPGVATQGVLSSAAEQADKVNGNLQDFLTESFTKTVFGTVLFSSFGTLGFLADKMELFNLNKIAKEYIDGVSFNFETNMKGEVKGFKAVDSTGGLSAEKVSFAQDLANSSFNKSGIFKVPYLGTGIEKLLTLPGIGTPLPKLLNSPFKTMRGFIDRVQDHSIITQGLAEGEVAPKKFMSLMNQSFASVRALSAQMNALHLERNGFDITNRPLGGLVNLGLNLHDKGLKLLAKDIDKSGYIARDVFNDEIQTVLRTKTPSKLGTVNEAAGMIRKHVDEVYSNYRKAYNLPEDWLPPKTAEAYLMRVYDTPYLNGNQTEWISAISGWLKEADETIAQHTKPIRDINESIATHKQNHVALLNRPNRTDEEIKNSSERLVGLKSRKKAIEEQLQNKLRDDPDLQLHVDDWNALSAREAEQIKQLTKRRDIAHKEVDERKKLIQRIKEQAQKRTAAVQKSKTVKTGKGNIRKAAIGEEVLQQEEAKLSEVQKELEEENEKLQQGMHDGTINPRLFTKKPNSFVYELKDPANRLKFRDVYENHAARETHAKAYYDTIMNQTPEDTINQVMGRAMGVGRENPLQSRTLLIPDKVLYDNNFMTKDLMAKVSNYTTYLARRTHLKTVFNDVSVDGGIEPLLEELTAEHERYRAPLNQKKEALEKQLENPDLSDVDKAKITKQSNKVDKQLDKVRKDFDLTKNQMNHIYEKMMGLKKVDRKSQQIKSVIMSLTSISNLPMVPLTMINDVSAIGLQHGVWPFIRDGLYPVIESLGGMAKTADSEAFRKSAGSVHLALQDALTGFADRNYSMDNNPYLNLGRWVHGLENIAHANSNATLTNYFDNGLQKVTGAVVQSELMRILHAFEDGSVSKTDSLYLRKYGIDPKWSKRMVDAFKQDGGRKTKLGGYQSNFWQWQDLEAANEFGQAVFRGIKNTQIQRGIIDSPFWADSIMGSIIHGFNGWMYASVNRYVIPSMQQPDAQKLLGVLFMLSTGALVSPMRRLARGESAYPDNTTDKQKLFATIQDSGYFSYFSTILADANVLTNDRLLADLKNDKYKDRTMTGLLGPAMGTANRMKDIICALASNEMNETDAKKMARMLPFANLSWTYWMSKKLIDSLGLPKNRAQAHAMKEYS